MRQVTLSNWSCVTKKTIFATVSGLIAFLSYPFVIAELAGQNMPRGWSPNLGGMSFAEIYKEIGPPQFAMSAKDYQDWVRYHWWGTEILKISSDDCCGQKARPRYIQYVVYVKGRDKPARMEFIFERTKD